LCRLCARLFTCYIHSDSMLLRLSLCCSLLSTYRFALVFKYTQKVLFRRRKDSSPPPLPPTAKMRLSHSTLRNFALMELSFEFHCLFPACECLLCVCVCVCTFQLLTLETKPSLFWGRKPRFSLPLRKNFVVVVVVKNHSNQPSQRPPIVCCLFAYPTTPSKAHTHTRLTANVLSLACLRLLLHIT